MESLTFQNVTFTYPDADTPALCGISLTVAAGEFLLLIGASGSGKTTLLRHAKPTLTPHGNRTGGIRLGSRPLETLSARDAAGLIGYVGQNPDAGFVTDSVWSELAFCGENLGMPPQQLRQRVAETASFFGLSPLFSRPLTALSGGQKQLVNLAAAMVTDPAVLLLDEPTAQLDPLAAENFFHAVRRLNRELGVTVVMTEQRPQAVFASADRVAVLEKGRLLLAQPPAEAADSLLTAEHSLTNLLPPAARIAHAFGQSGVLSVRDGKRFFAARYPQPPAVRTLPICQPPAVPPAVTLDEVYFRYERQGAEVLKGLSLSACRGQITALLGDNGAGKSTVLTLAAGLRKPQSGRVRVEGKTALLPQDPQTLFLFDSVFKELSQMTRDEAEISKIAELTGISDLLDRHPYDLSGGQQQWAALSKVLLCRPSVLLLDEPTKGLDGNGKARLHTLLRTLCADGVTVLLVSHDMAFCARCADTCVLLFDGQAVAADEPHRFFSSSRFYTTAASRISRRCFDNTITAEEVMRLCRENPPTGC